MGEATGCSAHWTLSSEKRRLACLGQPWYPFHEICETVRDKEKNSANPDKGKEKNVFSTNVIVKDRGSIFIGGLNEKNVKKSEEGDKYLSDIPVFGNLFRKRNTTKEKRNIYIEVEASIEEWNLKKW